MKRQIRRGVFETNSSSVHSITMCSQDDYSKWERGELYKERYGSDELMTRDEIIEELRTQTNWRTEKLAYPDVDWNNTDEVNELIRANDYFTEQEFWDSIDCETFNSTHTISSGEKVVAFGYYGYDG